MYKHLGGVCIGEQQIKKIHFFRAITTEGITSEPEPDILTIPRRCYLIIDNREISNQSFHPF